MKNKFEKLKEKFNDLNKRTKIIILTIFSLLLLYLLFCLIFMNIVPTNIKALDSKLGFTSINNVDNKLKDILDNQTFTIIGKDKKETKVKYADLKLTLQKDAKEKVSKDNNFWLPIEFGTKDMTKELYVINNDTLKTNLKNYLPKGKASENAKIAFSDGKYYIVKEVEGDNLNIDDIVKYIAENMGKENVIVDTSKFYAKPTIKEKDLVEKTKELNNLISKKFEIKFNDNVETITTEEIVNTIKIKENGDFDFSQKKLEVLFANRAAVHNKLVYTDTERQNISYKAGDIDKFIKDAKGDFNPVIMTMVENKDIKKLTQKANSDSKTYVEVNLTSQYMWYYKDGKLVMKTPIVSGDHSNEWDTPTGAFKLQGKATDQILDGTTVGFDYKYPVKYWMPFNGGVGFHDTRERPWSAYGSDTYLYGGGSHGCINMPPDKAEWFFNDIKKGLRVYVTP